MGLIASVSRRRAAEPAPEPIQHRADHLARRLGLRRGPRVLVHPTLTEPCLCGLARPVVLLPGRWLEGADPPRIDAVLAHELAHHRRLDLPVNLAQRLVES
ncbi:M56 family metallopeptidase, partial [Bremerella sp. JC817]